MMDILKYMQEHILYLDGGMGTLLQERGLQPGELPERWNLTRPEIVREIHAAYYAAGSNVVNTNTFGANPFKFSSDELEGIIAAAMENARWARDNAPGEQARFIALDVGPLGKLFAPYGDLDFEDGVRAFGKIVRLGAKHGADLVFIETMNDSYETKAALLAAKENCDLPVFVSNAYGRDGRLMTGAEPEAMVALLEGMGADAIGANCSLGPAELMGVMERIAKAASVPVLFKPNAGLPRVEDGKTCFDVAPADFAQKLARMAPLGVQILGGCCGTTPDYIRALVKATEGLSPVPVRDKGVSRISSYTRSVCFGEGPVLIGERINPTGKPRFKQALQERDMDYILQEGIKQRDGGVHLLDVNVGLPGIDEGALLEGAVKTLQAVLDLPLQIDTSDPAAMERALRIYNGKAMINSVNGKQESMDAIFPLVKKYGGLVVALTLDEKGIPATAQGRLEIAKKILKEAESRGLSKKDLIFDPLAMAVSADPNAALVTLEALRLIREELGCHTVLGVSNVSFGLPERPVLNHIFLACAMEKGLSAAIINPQGKDLMETYHAFRALHGQDENCRDYIAKFGEASVQPVQKAGAPRAEISLFTLAEAVKQGLKERALSLSSELLKTCEPMALLNEGVIPALDQVGQDYETGKCYLPQLLMSAEAAQGVFAAVKQASAREAAMQKGAFVLATVKGDIHDIGKNIVRLLLENYGYRVIDLGKDVSPEDVVLAVEECHAELVGLSALMTTTVPAMEKTIQLLRERVPACRVLVGGAVLNESYAAAIGADFYAKDAMDGVRYADRCMEKND